MFRILSKIECFVSCLSKQVSKSQPHAGKVDWTSVELVKSFTQWMKSISSSQKSKKGVVIHENAAPSTDEQCVHSVQ